MEGKLSEENFNFPSDAYKVYQYRKRVKQLKDKKIEDERLVLVNKKLRFSQ